MFHDFDDDLRKEIDGLISLPDRRELTLLRKRLFKTRLASTAAAAGSGAIMLYLNANPILMVLGMMLVGELTWRIIAGKILEGRHRR